MKIAVVLFCVLAVAVAEYQHWGWGKKDERCDEIWVTEDCSILTSHNAFNADSVGLSDCCVYPGEICRTFKIRGPDCMKICLTSDSFNLYNWFEPEMCDDYIEVKGRDGLYEKICAQDNLDRIYDTNELNVKFVSNKKGSDCGFKIEVNFLEEPPQYVTTPETCGVLCGDGSGGSASGEIVVPWYATFYEYGTNLVACAGSILSDEWILTAAHCFDEMSGAGMYVVVGDTDNSDFHGPEQVFDILEVHIHPGYPDCAGNDIALVKVACLSNNTNSTDGKIEFDGCYVRPICLPDSCADHPCDLLGQWCGVAGWETGVFGNDTGPIAMAFLAVMRQACCQKEFDTQLAKTEFCVGDHTNDSCLADCGGAVTCYDTKMQQFYAAGVVIGTNQLPCDQGMPLANTDVAYHKWWICQVTNHTAQYCDEECVCGCCGQSGSGEFEGEGEGEGEGGYDEMEPFVLR